MIGREKLTCYVLLFITSIFTITRLLFYYLVNHIHFLVKFKIKFEKMLHSIFSLTLQIINLEYFISKSN